MKRFSKILLFAVCSLSLISWDRASKELAKEHLKDAPAVSYLHDTFRLQYVENTGAAMSMGDDLSQSMSFWLLGMLPLALMLGMSVYVVKRIDTMSKIQLAAFTLIIAGGLGNLYDRLFFDRHVTDFMNIGFNNIRTGIFNFADLFITIGAVLMLWSFREKKEVATNG